MHFCNLNYILKIAVSVNGPITGDGADGERKRMSFPLCGHIPRLTYYRHVVRREQFFQYESIQTEWLVFAVEDGSFYYEIEHRSATASFGDLVFCPPGVAFRRVVISPVTLFVLRMNWADDLGNELDPQRLDGLPVGKVSLRDTDKLTDDYAAMKRHNFLDERWSMIRRNHHLHHIWLQICEQTEQLPSAEPPRSSDPLIEKATQLIREQAFERFSLQMIAGSLGVSRMQLCHKFQTELGTTPIKYATALRLEKAKKLLVETNLTLDQISECCGYQNGFYLSRVFKNNCGTTPKMYRLEHRL
ncbi:AraC family transcriptional regulator [Paenibacillus ginsengarvi]|uniref:AraC family transcriptional regulator n=2 Tax=Paenibacillus ginsengarvi TaxID=400777 RepID=A0A3B0AQ81_9BACL|nr:AraC family transcriptional regulator [Paenibacillus ginsengarvi]